jgi:hypothetical protein
MWPPSYDETRRVTAYEYMPINFRRISYHLFWKRSGFDNWPISMSYKHVFNPDPSGYSIISYEKDPDLNNNCRLMKKSYYMYRVSHNTWDYKNALGRPLYDNIEIWEVSHFEAKDHTFLTRGVRF